MRKSSKFLYLAAIAFILTLTLYSNYFVNTASAQSDSDYQVIKTERSERFVFPYDASNHDRSGPLVYAYDEPITSNWILRIENTMSYALREDAKTVVRLQEPAPSEKYIEVAMYGEEASNRYWVAVNTVEGGYLRVYDNQREGWETEGLITISHANNAGLTVTNGKRIVTDRLDLEGFTLGSVAVYGKDDDPDPINTYQGNITFELIYGDPSESSIFYLPLGITLGMGALIGGLLLVKKRRP